MVRRILTHLGLSLDDGNPQQGRSPSLARAIASLRHNPPACATLRREVNLAAIPLRGPRAGHVWPVSR